MGDWEFYPLPHYGQTPAEYVQRTRKTTWLVCDLSQQEPLPVGYTGLYLQPRHRVGIYRVAIAEAAYRGKGHGYRTTLMALEWAFKYLDLFSLHASLAASNKPSIGLHLKCGFKECGRYTLSRYEPAGRTDEIQMEILQSQWVSFCDGHHASQSLVPMKKHEEHTVDVGARTARHTLAADLRAT